MNNGQQTKTLFRKSEIENEHFYTITGKYAIVSKIQDMIQRANGTIIIAGTPDDLLHLYGTEICEKISSAIKKGVPIYIITQNPTKKQLKTIFKFNATKIKYGGIFSKTLTIVENNGELLMTSTMNENIQNDLKTAIFIDSTYDVQDIFSLCDLLLKSNHVGE